MERFTLIDHGIDVSEAVAQLDAHQELWNERPARRTSENSPHVQMSDIWVRFRPPGELKEPRNFAEPHFAEFYPAWDIVPALKPIVRRVMRVVEPVYLGGILITRIPPGGEILPHHDRGGWHAEWLRTKVYVPLRSNPDCVNECEGDERVMNAGEAWIFDNLVMHSVQNRGDTERITLIVCMRTEN